MKATVEAKVDLLHPDTVSIGTMHFQLINCGQYVTGNGIKHSNCCFYLSPTADVENKCKEKPTATRNAAAALALKVRLAELADQQPHDNKQMHAYSEAHTMAEWPVFMAYARLVGPNSCVAVPVSLL